MFFFDCSKWLWANDCEDCEYNIYFCAITYSEFSEIEGRNIIISCHRAGCFEVTWSLIRDFKIGHYGRLGRFDRCHVTQYTRDILPLSFWDVWSSQSIKIGIDLSIKIGKSDLIDIDCIDQSEEIDGTLVSFIDLSRFYRFHRFISEDTSVLLFIQKWKLISCKQWICWQWSCNWESKDQTIYYHFFY